MSNTITLVNNIDPRGIYRMTLEFVNGNLPTILMTWGTELEKLLTATYELHVDPGINPYNKRETSQARRITYAEVRSLGRIGSATNLSTSGPYWWSTPGLGVNDRSGGAQILDVPGKATKEDIATIQCAEERVAFSR